MSIDVFLFRMLNGLAGESEVFDSLVRLVAADHFVPVLATLSLLWLWLAGTGEKERSFFQRSALGGLAALGLASLVASLAAAVVGQIRPFVELSNVEMLYYLPTDPSFPAHPVTVVVAVGTHVLRSRRRLGLAIVGAGIALGVTRVIAGVFWPSDVIAGVFLGLVCGLMALPTLALLEPLPRLLTRWLLGTPSSGDVVLESPSIESASGGSD